MINIINEEEDDYIIIHDHRNQIVIKKEHLWLFLCDVCKQNNINVSSLNEGDSVTFINPIQVTNSAKKTSRYFTDS